MSKRWLDRATRAETGREGGFTLIELLVVIVILGILSAVVVFAVRGAGDKGQSAAFATDSKTFRTAEEAYCARFGSYGNEQQLVDNKFLSELSTITDVALSSPGPCGGTKPSSGFSLATSAATVNVAANADQWQTSDTGSGADYSSSAFAYPLNSNLNEPLLLMNSDYTISGGLAASYERIDPGTNRNTVAGMTTGTPAALPTTPTAYPTCSGQADRPFCNATWRFHLRTGVKFHDGQDFNADDVIWTWRDRQPFSGSTSDGQNTMRFTRALSGVADPACGSATKMCRYDSIEKIDAYTVDFTPGIQNLRFPEQVLHPKGAIAEVLRDGSGNPMPAPAAEQTPGLSSPRNLGRHLDGSTDGLVDNTVNFGVVGSPTARLRVTGTPQGTGPFKYVSYTFTNPQGGGSASFLANSNYWGTEKAKVKGMNYTFIRDQAVRTAGLQSGQFDMAIDLNPLDVSTVQGSGKRVIKAPFGQNALIYVNKVVKDTPTTLTAGTAGPATPTTTVTAAGTTPGYRFNIGTDQAVRKAASLAIDRGAIITAVFNGNADPGRLMSPPGILGSYASVVPAMATNVGLARATLDTDGWTCFDATAGVPGVPGAGTACAVNEIRKWNGTDTSKFAIGRPLTLYMIGISLVPQTEYDLMSDQMKLAGINLVTQRGACDSGTYPLTCTDGSVSRGQMYNSSMWDFDLELPNQNDANPAFLPVLRQGCASPTNFRFAPADGTNGISATAAPDNAAAPNPAIANGGGTFPFGKTPCTSPGVSLGAIDSPTITPTSGWIARSNAATTADDNQNAAANIMNILSNQNLTNIVIPVVAQGRIYGMNSKVNIGDPHPSQTSQRWVSLTMTF